MPLLGQASFSVAVGYDCSVCKHLAFLGTPVCSLVKSVSHMSPRFAVGF